MNSYNIPSTRGEGANDPAPEAGDVDKWSEGLRPINFVRCKLVSPFGLDPPIGTKAEDQATESPISIGTEVETCTGFMGTTLFLDEVALSSGLGVWSKILNGSGSAPKGSLGRICER